MPDHLLDHVSNVCVPRIIPPFLQVQGHWQLASMNSFLIFYNDSEIFFYVFIAILADWIYVCGGQCSCFRNIQICSGEMNFYSNVLNRWSSKSQECSCILGFPIVMRIEIDSF